MTLNLLTRAVIVLITLLISEVFGFVPQQRPGSNSFHADSSRVSLRIASGDSVLVVGGTGGVGQLVTKKLSAAGYSVTVSSRDVDRAAETIDDGSISVVPLDLVQGKEADIEAALEGKQAVVISVGTTAFPTFKWANGNTPEAIDKDAVSNIARVASKFKGRLKKIVILTSVGVDRVTEMPFLILNLFKVLDCKKAGEEAVKGSGIDYAIVRPGRLIGGPYTNPDVAKLLQVPGGAENGVDVQNGDALLGDCSRDACAEAVVQCLTNSACQNIDFSIVSNDRPALSTDEWTDVFSSMKS